MSVRVSRGDVVVRVGIVVVVMCVCEAVWCV